MAVQSIGAPAPTASPSPSTIPGRLRLVPGTTRTRRNHGTFMLGGQLACVYSARRADACYGVSFELGAGTLTLTGAMTPSQARAMARALSAAADATDAKRPAQAALVALPGLWREPGNSLLLVRLDVPAGGPGMAVVAVDGTDWQRQPEQRFQVRAADLVRADA